MATVICNVEDCVHRSKYPLRKWTFKDGKKCYGCRLKFIAVGRMFDMDGDMEATVGRENTAICRYYDPMEED